MMHHAHGVRNNIDSIDYYRNKILSISNDLEIRGKSHSYSGYSYYNIFYKYSKSIEHYNKALQILEFPENKELRPYQIKVLVNLNSSLFDLNIIENAEKIVMKSQNSVGFRLATVFGYSYRMRTDLLVNNFVFNAIKDKKLTIFELFLNFQVLWQMNWV